MRIRVSVRRFARLGVVINMSAVAPAAGRNADQHVASPRISCCRAHSMGKSQRRGLAARDISTPLIGLEPANTRQRRSFSHSRRSPGARDCVVELVGLEPTTRVLWNVGVSDQLTLSDTKHSSSKRPANDGHFHKSGNLRCARMRGRAGRTRTSNQTVKSNCRPTVVAWSTTGPIADICRAAASSAVH
jgi:hypothetical protein